MAEDDGRRWNNPMIQENYLKKAVIKNKKNRRNL